MDIINTLSGVMRRGPMPLRLIIINVAVFIVLKLLALLAMLGLDMLLWVPRFLQVPAWWGAALAMPWTWLTYTFVHVDFFHLLFNMLMVYWFGSLYCELNSGTRLVWLYICGALGGALAYVLGHTFIATLPPGGVLAGASASVMALVVAVAVANPERRINLFLIGSVSLKWVAIIFVSIDLLSITQASLGSHLAHFGGLLAGAIFVKVKHLSIPHIDFRRYFRPRRTSDTAHRTTDARWTEVSETDIDRILDKIKHSGYSSLTADEKRQLFEVSRKR